MDTTFSFAGFDVPTLGAVVVTGLIMAIAARVLMIFSAVTALVRVAAYLALGCIVVAGVIYAKELLTGGITADDLTDFRHSVTESWPKIQDTVDHVLPEADSLPAMSERAWNALIEQGGSAE